MEILNGTFYRVLISMQAWLLALIVLIGVCAIGTYYVNNTRSGLEGFDSSGNATIALKNAAQATCEKNYNDCRDKGTSNKTCTETYNKCNEAAQKLSTAVSTVDKAPASSTTLSSAIGAIAYAKSKGMTGAGDSVKLGKSGDLLKLQYGNTSPYDDDPTTTEAPKPEKSDYSIDSETKDEGTLDPKMKSLRDRIAKGYKPNAADFKIAQALGIINEGDDDTISLYSRLADYVATPQKIKPHETPKPIPTVIKASLKSDEGTGADDGQDISDSLRSQIRRDIRQAIRDELEEIHNEYEVRYD